MHFLTPPPSRQRSARYIGAALAAFLVVSTLYYLQLPAGYSPSHPFDRQAPLAVPPPPWQQPGASNSPIWDARANRVKQAFLHAYNGYLRHAAGHDEIRPLSNTAVDKCVFLPSIKQSRAVTPAQL